MATKLMFTVINDLNIYEKHLAIHKNLSDETWNGELDIFSNHFHEKDNQLEKKNDKSNKMCLCLPSSALGANSSASLRGVIRSPVLPLLQRATNLLLTWDGSIIQAIYRGNMMKLSTLLTWSFPNVFIDYWRQAVSLFSQKKISIPHYSSAKRTETALSLVFYCIHGMCCIPNNNWVNSISPFLHPQCCLHQLSGLKNDVWVSFSK